MSGSNGWTPERRARQAEAIRRWQPWARSTGPRTAEGKAVSARNADKGGHRPRHRAQLRQRKVMNRAARELIVLMRAAYADGNLRGECIDPAFDRSPAFREAQARYEEARAEYWRVTWRTDDPGFLVPMEEAGLDLAALAALVTGDDDGEPQ